MRVVQGLALVALLSSAVACGSNPPRAIGGTVSGLAGTGLTLQDNGGDDLAISADGPFVFAKKVADATPYSVTVSQQPTGPSQVCTVTQAGTKATADVKDVAVTCTTSTFTVSGTVAGLSGSGLVLQDNAGDDLKVTANGTFSFAAPVASGHAYAVTVKTQPSNPAQTCTVSGGAGTVGAGPVSSVTVSCSVNTYAIGGTVTGLAGTGLTLKDNGGDDLPISANGTFAFPKAVASGQTYAVTVSAQPSQPTQNCIVAGGSGTVVAGNVTSVAITCSTNVYKVSGVVSGLAGSGLVLSNANGDSVSIAQNGQFVFGTLVASGQPYAVTVQTQPTSPSQTCVVGSGSGNVVASDVTNITVACTTNTYNVTGTVSGLAGTGLKLQDNGGDTLSVSANGSFKFATPVASGQPYAVTVATQPSSPSQTCTVTNGAGVMAGADISNVTVACVTNTYRIGGTVSGLAGTVALQDNGGDTLSVSANGAFVFATRVASGATYVVTAPSQPTSPSQTCTVTNASGTVVSSDVSNVAVTCVTNKFNVKVAITGLAGSGLVLQDNGGDNLTANTNSTYTFATKVASGSPYSVSVLTQPSSPWQTCAVSSPSGVVGGADVLVNATCTTNSYAVGGTVSSLGSSATVVLQDNGANDLAVTGSGSFTFPAVASGQTYSVTVKTQPSGFYCTVSNASGTVTNAAVTNVAVSCTGVGTLKNPLASTEEFVGNPNTTFNAVWADSVTGKVYASNNYSNVTTFIEYPDFANYKVATNGRTITLATATEGTYHAALNGSLYYAQNGTNTLVRASAANGSVLATQVLTGAGHTNQSYFNWGGYSDICFFVDAGKLYVLWATPGGGNMTVTQLDPATLALGQSWTIPRAKLNTGWAFIAGGSVYVGASYNSLNMVGRYDLAGSTYDPTYTNALTNNNNSGQLYVTQMSFDQPTNRLFEGLQNSVITYANVTY